MSRHPLSAVGLLAFAGLSGFHLWSLWHVAGYYLPALAPVVAVLLTLLWLGGLGLMLYAIRSNDLKTGLLTVFVYVMGILLIGMRVLEGVPAQVAEGSWRDPQHRLTPDARYLLHNHSNVIRVLSEAEYRLYQHYAACYISAGLMLLAAGLCLFPLDRDGQLQGRPRVTIPRPVVIAQCPHCLGPVPADALGRVPPWCPHCGATL
jgi:hypothetical protein